MIRDGSDTRRLRRDLGDRTVTLNATQVKTLKAGAYADGKGLYLHVTDAGDRAWAFRFTAPDGRRAVMEFAKVTDLGLSAAREQALAYHLAERCAGNPILR